MGVASLRTTLPLSGPWHHAVELVPDRMPPSRTSYFNPCSSRVWRGGAGAARMLRFVFVWPEVYNCACPKTVWLAGLASL